VACNSSAEPHVLLLTSAVCNSCVAGTGTCSSHSIYPANSRRHCKHARYLPVVRCSGGLALLQFVRVILG